MKLITWLITALLFAVCGMGVVYSLQRQEYSKELNQINLLSERQEVSQKMIQALERYRRLSGQFRRMSEPEISKTKSSLKSDVVQGTSQLDQLDPTSEEQVWSQKLNQQLAEFMVLSAKLEPMLFL